MILIDTTFQVDVYCQSTQIGPEQIYSFNNKQIVIHILLINKSMLCIYCKP